VDVGAIEFIHRRLIEERERGKAILLISLELDEVRSLADRIVVMYGGRTVGELDAEEATDERLGLLMAGRGGEEGRETA
jgi:simple sugar transport system ATP-binding protein